MKRLMLALVLPAALTAQQVPNAFFQNAITSTGGEVKVLTARAAAAKPVTGRPLTANEERHSVQVLADGTRIESKTVDKFYRDDQGRTRTERQDGSVSISDPVAGTRAEIASNGRVIRATDTFRFTTNSASADVVKLKAEADALTGVALTPTPRAVTMIAEGSYSIDSPVAPKMATPANELHKEENLGVQTANGVLADGTRTTTTIPAGQIGNDRPIDIVSERWYSTDLQMLIKSVNKDPRFGETSYELTNIQQGAPDASLFKIPAGSHQ
jgi:hypothetical protein